MQTGAQWLFNVIYELQTKKDTGQISKLVADIKFRAIQAVIKKFGLKEYPELLKILIEKIDTYPTYKLKDEPDDFSPFMAALGFIILILPEKLEEWSKEIEIRKNCIQLALNFGKSLPPEAARMVANNIHPEKIEENKNPIFLVALAGICAQAARA